MTMNEAPAGGPIRVVIAAGTAAARALLREEFQEAGFVVLAVVELADLRWDCARTVAAEPDVVVIEEAGRPAVAETFVRLLRARSNPLPYIVLLRDEEQSEPNRPSPPVVSIRAMHGAPEETVHAVRLVVAGYELYAEPGTSQVSRPAVPLSELTRRERDVLILLARGLGNAEMSSALHLSLATIRSHVQRLLVKLDCGSRAAAVCYAYESGLVTASRTMRTARPDGAECRPASNPPVRFDSTNRGNRCTPEQPDDGTTRQFRAG